MTENRFTSKGAAITRLMRLSHSKAFRAAIVAVAVMVLATIASSLAHIGGTVVAATASGQEDGGAAPIYGIKIPHDYRDWRMISVADVGAPVNDLRVKLGNDRAISAYRSGKLPFPDGAIIARLAYQQVQSEQNNQVFRAAAEKQGLPPEAIEKLLAGSFVAGPPTTVQFMVKDSKKYATTGGWGFAEFTSGKPSGEAVHKTCFGCHGPAKDHDFVFTRYSN